MGLKGYRTKDETKTNVKGANWSEPSVHVKLVWFGVQGSFVTALRLCYHMFSMVKQCRAFF